MVSRQIIVFKCVVNICNQDFGTFCRERDPEGKKRFPGEQPGATKPAPEDVLGMLVEVSEEVDWVEWGVWAALAIKNVGAWMWELKSLLGWLWWHWVFLLGGVLGWLQ